VENADPDPPVDKPSNSLAMLANQRSLTLASLFLSAPSPVGEPAPPSHKDGASAPNPYIFLPARPLCGRRSLQKAADRQKCRECCKDSTIEVPADDSAGFVPSVRHAHTDRIFALYHLGLDSSLSRENLLLPLCNSGPAAGPLGGEHDPPLSKQEERASNCWPDRSVRERSCAWATHSPPWRTEQDHL
jgi:hypothetical protein